MSKQNDRVTHYRQRLPGLPNIPDVIHISGRDLAIARNLVGQPYPNQTLSFTTATGVVGRENESLYISGKLLFKGGPLCSENVSLISADIRTDDMDWVGEYHGRIEIV